jgi:hypothetical protein
MTDNKRLSFHYRALVIIAMRQAGMSLREIAGYFFISGERVRQICKRGPLPAQLPISFTEGETPCR